MVPSPPLPPPTPMSPRSASRRDLSWPLLMSWCRNATSCATLLETGGRERRFTVILHRSLLAPGSNVEAPTQAASVVAAAVELPPGLARGRPSQVSPFPPPSYLALSTFLSSRVYILLVESNTSPVSSSAAAAAAAAGLPPPPPPPPPSTYLVQVSDFQKIYSLLLQLRKLLLAGCVSDGPKRPITAQSNPSSSLGGGGSLNVAVVVVGSSSSPSIAVSPPPPPPPPSSSSPSRASSLRNLELDRECLLCLDAPSSVLCPSCGTGTCARCAAAHDFDRCPTCRLALRSGGGASTLRVCAVSDGGGAGDEPFVVETWSAVDVKESKELLENRIGTALRDAKVRAGRQGREWVGDFVELWNGELGNSGGTDY